MELYSNAVYLGKFLLLQLLLRMNLRKIIMCIYISIYVKAKFGISGAYDDEEAAAHAYDLAALKYWGPDTILNFPVINFFCLLKLFVYFLLKISQNGN